MGRPAIDWTDKKVGLIYIYCRDDSVSSGAGKHAKWKCRCDCGKSLSIFSNTLKRGIESCGCVRNYALKVRNTKHGMYGTALYETIMSNKKRAVKLRAMPKWANQEKIKEIYANCPKGWHVDHIVPLQGRNVCGLHVETNLQYLPARENARKKNKFSEEMLAGVFPA